MSKILIVEDDPELRGRIRDWLVFEHYQVEEADNGSRALEIMRIAQFDVILLDWMLPGLTGIDVCQQYRRSGGAAPILMLTGRKEIAEKEKGYAAGVDDYLTKPFDTRELSLRVRALLRRAPVFCGDVLTAGRLSLDPISHHVKSGKTEIHLQPLEFSLLEYLMRHPRHVLSADALLNAVWATDSEASVDTLRTYIKTLRKKIDTENEPSMIRTVHGFGYKFEPED